LLESIPSIAGPRPNRLTQIEGAPPDLSALGPGCPFAVRCPLAFNRCDDELPELAERTAGHFAACWSDQVVGNLEEERENVHAG
jgi:oligopeptide/dipeptide ABC transporter ATP-binding protein